MTPKRIPITQHDEALLSGTGPEWKSVYSAVCVDARTYASLADRLGESLLTLLVFCTTDAARRTLCRVEGERRWETSVREAQGLLRELRTMQAEPKNVKGRTQ